MSEQKNDIEIFDSEDDIVIESLNNQELYDLKGNLITVDDARNTLPDNADLIQKAINGDKKAFETLYMQSYRYVFFIIRQYIPDDETTYDAIQEAFIKVYKNISGLREPKAYYGWLTTIAKNTAIDVLRTKPSDTSLVYEEKNETLTKDDETQKDVSLDIESVLKKLDPEDADLLSLVYYDGMRVSQIAKMQGVPATTVYSRFNKAKKNLKAQLNAHGIDKAIYSGNFISMVTVAMRNIIGTALLSVAIAQQILDSIINGKGKKEIAVAKIIRAQQKKAILKIASVIVAISMITSLFTFLTLDNLDKAAASSASDKYRDTIDTTSDAETTVDVTDSDSEDIDNSIVSSSENPSEYKNNSSKSSISGSSKDSSVSVDSSDTASVSSADNSGNHSVSSSKNESSGNNSTTPQETVPDVFGTSVNNVMKFYTDDFSPLGAPVVKQDENIYYSDGENIYRVKTDGSQKQIIYTSEADYPMVTDLNLVGEYIFFIDNGIKSIKTDGSECKLIYDGAAYNLLVRGNTAWYADIDGVANGTAMFVSYVLYQLDLKTGENSVLVENGKGFGLKAVIDDTLVYVNGDTLYAKSLSDGSEKALYKIKYTTDTYYYGIENMCINGDEIYILEENRDYTSKNTTIVKLNLNAPQEVQKYTNINGDRIFALYGYIPDYGLLASCQDSSGGAHPIVITSDGTVKWECGTFDAFSFDDEYIYYFDDTATILYRCLPDGSDLKTY